MNPPSGAAFRDGYFTVRDGLRLHYRDYPGPPGSTPLLCLPGLTRNVRDFAELAERLSPRYRVLVLEFRGRGESEFDPQPHRYMPLTYAHDVIALLDHVGIADAVFVGTSLGGLVTMTLAVIEEERIAAAILNDVGPELEDVGIDRIRGYVGGGKSFASWTEAGKSVGITHQNLPVSHTAADWERIARRLCKVDDDGTIRFDYDMAIADPFNREGPTEQVDMWPFFNALAQHPLLVVRGERSDLLSAAGLDKMRAAAPDMRHVTVAGVGHAPELIEPEAIAAIESFLAALDLDAA